MNLFILHPGRRLVFCIVILYIHLYIFVYTLIKSAIFCYIFAICLQNVLLYGSVRLMLRPSGQSEKIQSIKSSQYIGCIGYIGSIVHTG